MLEGKLQRQAQGLWPGCCIWHFVTENSPGRHDVPPLTSSWRVMKRSRGRNKTVTDGKSPVKPRRLLALNPSDSPNHDFLLKICTEKWQRQSSNPSRGRVLTSNWTPSIKTEQLESAARSQGGLFSASTNKPASVCLLHSPTLCLNYEINNSLHRVLTAGKNDLIVTGTALTQPLGISSSTLKPTRLNTIALICSLQVKKQAWTWWTWARCPIWSGEHCSEDITRALHHIIRRDPDQIVYGVDTSEQFYTAHQVSVGRGGGL